MARARATPGGGAGRRRAAACAAALAVLGGCFGDGAELSPSGKGLPQVTVDFVTRAQPDSVHTSELSVRNPGPGNISLLTVAFARVGAPAAQGLPNPIVDRGRGPDSGRVVGVTPEPSASSDVVYRFGPLQEGASLTISFELRVPQRPGLAANSVTVYDDADPQRVTGVRLETTVER